MPEDREWMMETANKRIVLLEAFTVQIQLADRCFWAQEMSTE